MGFLSSRFCLFSFICALCWCSFLSPVAISDDSVDKAVDLMMRYRWFHISTNEFPSLPDEIPYAKPRHVKLYIQGYKAGLSQGIEALRADKWHIGDTICETEEENIHAEGWRAAAKLLMERNFEMRKSLCNWARTGDFRKIGQEGMLTDDSSDL